MKIAVLYGYVPPDAPADEQDVLVEVDAVSRALRELGHEAVPVAVTMDLRAAADALARVGADMVFNLVESVDGMGRLIHTAPAVIDMLGMPYTGCPTEAVFTTSNKLLAKRTMRLAGIPTPDWHAQSGAANGFVPGRPLIVKSVWEHASIGLDENSVITPSSPEALASVIEERAGSLGGVAFAEEYVEGRELNISLIEMDGVPEVLPPAEIKFLGLPEGRRRLVDYRAKWDEDSVEYRGTKRSLIFPESDRPLLEEVASISRDCWRVFGLAGYARVDFRVDERGMPWVLEVNVNPCVSPDSGFVAAAKSAGMGYSKLMKKILQAVTSRRTAKAGAAGLR